MTRAALVIAAALLTSGKAAVVSLDIESRSELAGGKAFGSAGRYERLAGRVRFALDPAHAQNRVITDITRAGRNSDGLIEFSADVYLLRPVDLSKGNRTVLFEVVNRGKKGMLPVFNRARTSNDPVSAEDLGDERLLKEGYTLVWLGWQHDVPRTEGLMMVNPPVASGVRGLVRSEYTASAGTKVIPLGDSEHIPYPVSDGSKVAVSVRRDIYGPRTKLPFTEWTLNPNGTILLSKEAVAGSIYEIVYESSNPPVAGVGLAAIRDFVSFVKRDHRYAIGFGISQSAMVLRALLYEGFNQDENGKQVFDGVFAHVAGARRTTFQRFTQPSRTAGPLRNASLSTTEQFPFSDLPQRNPNTGVKDGVLEKAMAANVAPKIFYTNSAYEYWGSGASLLHTTPDGIADVQLPASTRMYVFAGGQHGPARFPPEAGNGQHLANFNDYRWHMRALLSRLQAWVSQDELPPASVYPTIAAKTLVPLRQYGFPRIPGVAVPANMHVPHSLDFGPKYRSSGIVTLEPPRTGRPFAPLVPQADADGNDVGAVRMPEIACAIGTFTGWNLRQARAGLDQYLLGNTGSYLPFPQTAAERQQSGDPRRAIEERHPDQNRYLACVEARSEALSAAGLLLESDKRPIGQAAARHWQWRMKQSLFSSTQRR